MKPAAILSLAMLTMSAAAAALAAPAAPAAAAAPVAEATRALYQQHCAACHAAARLGQMGPALLPDNLARLRRDEALRVIRDGRPATQMPGFGEQLGEAELAALADFIYTPVSPAPAWSATPPPAPTRSPSAPTSPATSAPCSPPADPPTPPEVGGARVVRRHVLPHVGLPGVAPSSSGEFAS